MIICCIFDVFLGLILLRRKKLTLKFNQGIYLYIILISVWILYSIIILLKLKLSLKFLRINSNYTNIYSLCSIIYFLMIKTHLDFIKIIYIGVSLFL